MVGSSPTLRPIDPLLAESSRSGTRVRLVLKTSDADDRRGRIVEGIVLAILEGRDGRPRVRMGIPTGSGDPVEVRVLLESIDRVERVDPAQPAPITSPSPAYGTARPDTGAHRRATLIFGRDSGTRFSSQSGAASETPSESPRRAR